MMRGTLGKRSADGGYNSL